jgi:hypothetical protein
MEEDCIGSHERKGSVALEKEEERKKKKKKMMMMMKKKKKKKNLKLESWK